MSQYDDPFDCLDCGTCDGCVQRAIDYAEEMARETSIDSTTNQIIESFPRLLEFVTRDEAERRIRLILSGKGDVGDLRREGSRP